MVYNQTRDRYLSSDCYRAETFWSRLKGLLGRDGLPKEETLWLDPCSSIHTFFMKFPIDVIFLDEELKILHIAAAVKPWRLSSFPGAKSALERAGGSTVDKAGVGDMLKIY
ncbi:MAG: DUF192 domain-containing protein [Elusimicrobia bacterium]|nr:DUF192 domain-containing protein [Elusimicrobiota bacterium]